MVGITRPTAILNPDQRVKQEGLFFRIHKSHAVNLLYVLRVDTGTVTMVDGTTLPVSDEAKKELENNLPSC